MSKKVLLLSVTLLVASWAMAPSGVQAVNCINVPNVTLLPAAGCDLGGLTFSNFTVSAVGFTNALVGLGAFSTVSPTNVNLLFQLAPTPGIGPGDVLLSYGVAVLPESGPLAPRELEPAAVRDKCSAGPKLGRGDVR
jgi:hypothetical protein